MAVKHFLIIGLLWWGGMAQASPVIQHWTLDNGLRVYFVESHELPMVQLSLAFDAGSARDPADRHGLAMMTVGMLGEGAGERDANAIASAFEGLGAEFGASSERDMATLSLRTLSQPELLAPAIDVLHEVLMQPSFPADALERERQRALIALQASKESPAAIADQRFYGLLYGDHPYAHQPEGNEKALRALDRKDLLDHHRDYYVAANGVLGLVGDLTPRQARALAERLAGKLPKGKAAPPLPKVAMLRQPVVERIDFPSSQTHLLVGQPGMHRKDPDYFALYVGNYILGGGGLVSRLSDEVREKHGLSYSVYSYFLPLREDGPLLMGLQTKNSQQEKALTLLRKTVQEFVGKGPTEKELEAAKKHLTGGFPLRIDSNKEIAAYLTVIGFYGLPLTYLEDFIPTVQALTVDSIRDAFQRRVHPDKLVTVSVGRQARSRPTAVP